MNAYPGPYSILVLDNASIHKGQHLLNICNTKGVRIEYLPPYSPDFNPVSNIKFKLYLYIIFKILIFLLYRSNKHFFI